MAARQQRRREQYLEEEEPFRTIAFSLIIKMLDLNNRAPDAAKRLVDEILHSIFFCGMMSRPSFSPERILSDAEMLNELTEHFPRPFDLYSSQLPRRSPFSCVLDMIVLLSGRQNDTVIKDGLTNLLHELMDEQNLNAQTLKHLVSSTICVSHRTDNEDQVKYYGVSIATPPGRIFKRSMIAASCLSSWDRYVAGAVMTYFPENRSDFDGTIQLPEYVSCEAFHLLDGNIKPPCIKCQTMFGLETVAENVSVAVPGWFHGNCAEVESLSNLFKNEDDVKDQARPTSEMYSDERRETVETDLTESLREWLRSRRFTWGGDFYSPQWV